MSEDSKTGGARSASERWKSVALALVLFAVSVGLQCRNGAYRSDIGDDPDEPAHVVTSLMMRDYLAIGLWHGEHPLTFAQRYYDAFPKVALGHYPPGFYLVAGVWLLPVASKTSLLLLIAVLATALALVTVRLGKDLRLEHAVFAGIWVVVLPVVQKQTMLVMSDLLLCIGFLLSARVFAKFLDGPTVRNSMLFGLLAAATMLTKASGAALALVPPIAIALTGRWSLLRNWRLWLAPVPVLLTAVPWTLLTLKITSEGMVRQTVSEYAREALRFYLGALVPTLGPVLVIGSVIATGFALFRWSTRKEKPSAFASALVALVVAVLVLYVVSPSGMSTRYILPIAPAAILATIWAMEQTRDKMGWTNMTLKPELLVLIVVSALSSTVNIHKKQMSGFFTTGEKLLASDTSGRVLISSDARGEGALTAEMAFRIANRTESPWQVVRASKFMASSDWLGRDYEAKFADVAALAAGLKREHVAWIIHDTGIPEGYEFEHHRLMRKLVDDANAVEVVARMPSGRGVDVKPAELILCRVK